MGITDVILLNIGLCLDYCLYGVAAMAHIYLFDYLCRIFNNTLSDEIFLDYASR